MSTKGELYAGVRHGEQEPLDVGQIRGVVATLVDNLEQLPQDDPHIARLAALAQSKFEEACMYAVKAVYATATKLENP